MKNIFNCLFKNNQSISNISKGNHNTIVVNGKVVWQDGEAKETIYIGNTTIEFTGNWEILVKCSEDVNGNISTVSGHVHVGSSVSGNVETTSGDVRIRGNANNIETVSGNVEVKGDVLGKISTVSGDIF